MPVFNQRVTVTSVPHVLMQELGHAWLSGPDLDPDLPNECRAEVK